MPGLGVRGIVDGGEVIAGQAQLLRDCGLAVPDTLARRCGEWSAAGRTVVLAGWAGQARGAVAVADALKPSAAGGRRRAAAARAAHRAADR